MTTKAGIQWFKSEFGASIADTLTGSPLSRDLLVAIACQETGYLWQAFRKSLETADVLALCVGDTIDASGGRSAFPRTKADLLSQPRGEEMFEIAREALTGIARYNSSYANVARNPDKFCYGFGVFHYDLQFFLDDPDFFLERRWHHFEPCLQKVVIELRRALAKFSWTDRQGLTDEELAYIAIRYNRGGFDPSHKLRQGHFSGGKYYGEWIAHFLELAKTVPMLRSRRPGAVADQSARGLASTDQSGIPSYHPLWAWRRGDITAEVMERLPAGTIIGVHHRWGEDAVEEILDYPGKNFVVAWYCASNLDETGDPLDASGVPVATRIAEARATQDLLEQRYPKARFADLIELDLARNKKSGDLDGEGNSPADWLADAKAVHAAGFRYVARNPQPAHVKELRQKIGRDFVPRIVFDNVSLDEAYRRDALALADGGEPLTLVLHKGGDDGDPETALLQAKATVRSLFSDERMNVEAYYGMPEDDDTALARISSFARLGPAPADVAREFDAATEVIRRAIARGNGTDAPSATTVPALMEKASFTPRLGPETQPVALRALRIGMQGDLVRAWQSFLLGQGLDPGGLDGDFSDKTVEATRSFQRTHGLDADGVAGRQTLLKAMALGFELIEEPAADTSGSNFPPRPSFSPLSGTAARQAVFGHFSYVPAPFAGNRERIRILGEWEANNVVTVPVPQLRNALGAAAPTGMRFHKNAAAQLEGLWREWGCEGLLGRIKSFDGAFVARFIRGSQSVLSNHAFGSAFDINAATNGLGVRPPLVGNLGSVRELVPIAHKWGFYWGGHFGSRPDGMHFEIARLL